MVDSPDNRREIVWATLGSIAFALCFAYQLVGHLTQGNVPGFVHFGGNDWDPCLQLQWVAYYTISHFHQFPLWNPYKCGGMPMLGDPQSKFLAPFFLPAFFFGPVTALHLSIIAHIAIGFGGAYFLARMFRVSPLGAIACAGVFVGSSWIYLRSEIGHLGFISFVYSPWAIGLLFLGVDRRRLTPAALCGLGIALMLLEGGLYQVWFTAVMLTAVAVIVAAQRRDFSPIALLAIAGAFAAGFAAIKLFPSIAYSGVTPRVQPPTEAMSLRQLFAEMFDRNQSPMRMLDGSLTRFWELGAYLGAIYAGLAILGILFQFRRALPWTILALGTLSIAAGDFGYFSPWVLMHHLPIFISMRQPPRWLIPSLLAIGVLAGLGLDTIRVTAKPWGSVACAILIGLALIDSWSVSARHMHFIVEQPQSPMPQSASFRQASDPKYYYLMYMSAMANVGALTCYENFPPDKSANLRGFDQNGYLGEQHLLGPGKLTLTNWSPNSLSFNVDVDCATIMAINQNYDSNWRIAAGRGEIVSEDSQLAVVLPAGRQSVTLVYRSIEFFAGLCISMAAWAALFAVWLYERRRGGIMDKSPVKRPLGLQPN